MPCFILVKPCFNSIKVQLERVDALINEVIVFTFQFHKGSIRTELLVKESVDVPRFNSIKVQLEHHNHRHPTLEKHVSIP